MGCRSSAPAAALDTSAGVTLVIAGPREAGKTTFARRFTRVPDSDATPFERGTRIVTINGDRIPVTLVAYEHATPAELEQTDGVLYVVRGDTSAPFNDIYKFTDELYNKGPKAACIKLRSLTNVERRRSKCDLHASFAGSPDELRGSAHSTHSTSSDGGSTVFTPTKTSLRQVSPQMFGRSDEAGLGAGQRAGWASPTRWEYRLPGSTSGETLRLDTKTTEDMGASFRKPKQRDTFDPHSSALPMDVAVTHCDILDAQAGDDPHTLIRLRAMAANWSSANRCRVTFVSAKSGVGVNSALAHVIKRVYVKRATQAASAQA